LVGARAVAYASSHDYGGQADYGDQQEKADNYECLKDPAHRRAPVYTLRVYSRGSATRDANRPTFNQ
jgi:hypothetical protein